MKKAEIIRRLKELQKILDMDAQDYADKINGDHKHNLSRSDAWCYRTGVVAAEIEYILKN